MSDPFDDDGGLDAVLLTERVQLLPELAYPRFDISAEGRVFRLHRERVVHGEALHGARNSHDGHGAAHAAAVEIVISHWSGA